MDEIGGNCNLIVLQQVDSTNTYAKNHFDTLLDLSVIAAIEQTAAMYFKTYREQQFAGKHF